MEPGRPNHPRRTGTDGDSDWLLAGPEPVNHAGETAAVGHPPSAGAEHAAHAAHAERAQDLAQAAQVIAAHRLSLPTLEGDLDAARAVMSDAAAQDTNEELERLIERDMLRLLPEVESVGVYPGRRIDEAQERLAAAPRTARPGSRARLSSARAIAPVSATSVRRCAPPLTRRARRLTSVYRSTTIGRCSHATSATSAPRDGWPRPPQIARPVDGR